MTRGASGPDDGPAVPSVIFGSAPGNDVVIPMRMVSGRHARIFWDGQALILEDLGSTNGTKHKGKRVARAQIEVGDELSFGSHRFVLEAAHLNKLTALGIAIPGLAVDPLSPVTALQARPTRLEPPRGDTNPPPRRAATGELMGRAKGVAEVEKIPAGALSLNIGYTDDNDVVLPVNQVSGHHCRLWKTTRRYILEDLGSTNGTFVRGERVIRAYVSPEEVISLGSYQLKLDKSIIGLFKASKHATQATRIAQLPVGLLRPIKIGRDKAPGRNDIVLDAVQVSNEHCELQFTGSGWRVKDLGSTNGTYIGSTHNRVTEAVATESDVLFFGSYRFPLSRLAEFVPGLAEEEGGEVQVPTNKALIFIGRDENCDLTIDAPQVSRRHARLRRKGESWFIEDLGSANGTYVNGKRVSKAQITEDDWISLGSHQLKLDLETGTVARSYEGDIMLQAENITVKVDRGRKTILHNISFTAYPTEFVGLMGPSGAGKTTLMMALNGYLPPSKGRSLINSKDLYSNYNAFRGNIGYVPQDDIIHSQLSVFEALYYTARLRLPPDTRNSEIDTIITRVLRQLEIEETRDVLIGSPEKKGISGGQRKRVNLAQELLTQPSLLFLDEPTSGLASEDAINVMKLFRRLADDGRTILLTIHQPSLEAYRTMDNIVYLADGHLVYYGPTYPDSITFFNPDIVPGTPEGDRVLADPGYAMRPIAADRRKGLSMVPRARNYIDSRYFQEYVQRRRSDSGDAVITGGSKQKVRRRFGLRQWWILARRYFTIKLKDVANTTILLLQAPIIATIIVLVFRNELGDSFGRVIYEPLALFLLAISSIWFGCSNAAREIVSEQAIYRRERMVNLKIGSYVMSKFTVLGFICAVQCMVLLTMAYLGLGLFGNFFEMFFILFFCSLAGVGMGLVLSALVRTSEAAIALVPLLLIPQVILAGMIIPITSLTAPMKAVSATMMTRWGFEALLHAEDRHEAFEITEEDVQDEQEEFEDRLRKKNKKKGKKKRRGKFRGGLEGPAPPVPVPEHPLDRYFEDHESGTARDLGVLFIFNILMLLGVVAIMKLKDPEVG